MTIPRHIVHAAHFSFEMTSRRIRFPFPSLMASHKPPGAVNTTHVLLLHLALTLRKINQSYTEALQLGLELIRCGRNIPAHLLAPRTPSPLHTLLQQRFGKNSEMAGNDFLEPRRGSTQVSKHGQPDGVKVDGVVVYFTPPPPLF